MLRSTQDLERFCAQKKHMLGVASLIAGVRYAQIETVNLFIPAGDPAEPEERNEQSDWPALLGVLYDLTHRVSLFANRSNSFLPREGTTQGGKPFPPERSVQYEVGRCEPVSSVASP